MPEVGTGMLRKNFYITQSTVGVCIVYFYGPIGVLMGGNLILFALTVIAFCKATRDTMVVRKNQAKQK